MPTPETQITVRIDKKDLPALGAIKTHAAKQPLPASGASMHRAIYSLGVAAMHTKLGLDAAPLAPPAAEGLDAIEEDVAEEPG